MSTIASNAEDLILNADGGSSTVKIKINGTEKASISSAGAFTSTTIDATALTGNLPAISGANLTSLPADATKLPLAGGTMTGVLNMGTADTVSTNNKIIFGKAVTASQSYLPVIQQGSPDGAGVDLILATTSGTGAVRIFTGNSGTSGVPFANSNTEKLSILSDGRAESQFTIAAWVNFDGRNTVAIRDSHNVSSIGDWGTGQYGIYFTTGFANSNYAYASMAQDSRIVSVERGNGKPDGSRLDVTCERSWDAALTDNETLSVLVIGDQ